jgi:sporulation protein YlmC with PRC-barrel domain
MQVNDPDQVLDRTVVDQDGSKIGTVTELYLDEHADRAGWIAVRTGFFGQHVAPVPLTGAAESEDVIVVPYSKSQVKDAPHHDPEMALSREEEAALFDYYGIGYDERSATAVTTSPGDEPTSADYTTEDAERLQSMLHTGSGQAGAQTRLSTRPVAGPVTEALPPEALPPDDATGTGGTGATASSAGLDVAEPPVYPDDATQAELIREREQREETVRERREQGLDSGL